MRRLLVKYPSFKSNPRLQYDLIWFLYNIFAAKSATNSLPEGEKIEEELYQGENCVKWNSSRMEIGQCQKKRTDDDEEGLGFAGCS